MTPWFSALFRPLSSGARDDQGILAKSGAEDRQKTKKRKRKSEGKRRQKGHQGTYVVTELGGGGHCPSVTLSLIDT